MLSEVVVIHEVSWEMVLSFCPGGPLLDMLVFAWMVPCSVVTVLDDVGGGLVLALFCGGLLFVVLSEIVLFILLLALDCCSSN